MNSGLSSDNLIPTLGYTIIIKLFFFLEDDNHCVALELHQ